MPIWTPGGSVNRRLRGPVYAPATGGNSLVFQNFAWFCELNESSGDAIDSSVNGYDLTPVNSPGTHATGAPDGTRCREPAANSYFVDAALDFDRDWSLFGMARCENSTVFVHVESGGNQSFCEWLSNTVYMTVPGFGNTSAVAAAANTWFFYAITRNAATGQMALSINGGALQTVGSSGSGLKTLNLGNLPGYGSTAKRLWRTALTYYRMTADDVTTAYNSGTPLTLAQWAAL